MYIVLSMFIGVGITLWAKYAIKMVIKDYHRAGKQVIDLEC
jgi:hypothetical protein